MQRKELSVFSPINRWISQFFTVEQTLKFKQLHRKYNLQNVKKNFLTRKPSRVDNNNHNCLVIDKGFDSHEHLNQSLHEIKQAFQKVSLPFTQIPKSSDPYNPLIAFDENQIPKALKTVAELESSNFWYVEYKNHNLKDMRPSTVLKYPESLGFLKLQKRVFSPQGYSLTDETQFIYLEPWVQLGSAHSRTDGGNHVDGTLHRRLSRWRPYVEYLTPELERQFVSGQNRFVEFKYPHIYSVDEPIDLVYTWVDGNDPKWLKKKNRFLGLTDTSELNNTAISDSRFTNRDELKFSLRSVEAYANWVNHIYIVTDNQIPEWLDVSHPKITVIDHRDIFRDDESLPVFNSHAIESQLHHIPNLSERYLYLNDDIFFMKPVRPGEFFTSNGLAKYFPSTAPLDLQAPSSNDLPVLSAAKKGRQFMQENFGVTVTNKFRHAPQPQLKSVVEQMEKEYPELFREVAKSKFRHPNDYSLPSSLCHYYAYVQGKAIPAKIKYDYLDLAQPDAILILDWLLHYGSSQVLCLNDTDLEPHQFEQASKAAEYFFSRKFPIPSSFER